MKKVFTVGVFDLLHIGHVELFKKAKRYGEYLIVAVQNSDTVLKYKPKEKLVYSTEERMYMVRAIRYVDEVIDYRDVDEVIKNEEFDVFIIGQDQKHQGFRNAIQWCKNHGKEIVELPRTEGISSSWLKEQIAEMSSNS